MKPRLAQPVPPPALVLVLAWILPLGLRAQSAGLELEPPTGIPYTPGDLVRVPVFLRLQAEGFKYIAFGVASGPGSTIGFAPSPDLTGLDGVEYYVDQVLDQRHLTAGFGNFDFNDPRLTILTPGGRIRLGTVNLTIDPAPGVAMISLAVGTCACTDPEVSQPPVLHLGGSLKVEPESATVGLVLGNHDFIRGDPNHDGRIDISDAIRMIQDVLVAWIEPFPLCPDADDANDDGALDVSDPIYLLDYLFLGGPPPLSPFPAPGVDPTADVLPCRMAP
jgi:hypothetical protein